MPKEAILTQIRTALGRKPFQKPTPAPEPLLLTRNWTLAERLTRFEAAFTRHGGRMHVANSPVAAQAWVSQWLDGREAAASAASVLAECGIHGLPNVHSGFASAEDLRNEWARTGIGITSAFCALAESGGLVLRSSPDELASPAQSLQIHLVVLPTHKLLANLDEFLGLLPRPGDRASVTRVLLGPTNIRILFV